MGNSLSNKKTKSSKREEKLTSSNESLANENVKNKSKKKKKSVKEEGNSQSGVKKKLSFSKRFQEKPTKKKKKNDKKAKKEGGECSDGANDKNNFPQIIISSPSDVEASLEREVSKSTSHAPITTREVAARLPSKDGGIEKVPQMSEQSTEITTFTKNTSSNNSCNNSIENINEPQTQFLTDNTAKICGEKNELRTTLTAAHIDFRNSESNDTKPATLLNESVKPSTNLITADICSLEDADKLSEVSKDDASMTSEQIVQTSADTETFTVDLDVQLLVSDIIQQALNSFETINRVTELSNVGITPDTPLEPLLSLSKSGAENNVDIQENNVRMPDIVSIANATPTGTRSDLTVSSETVKTAAVPISPENTLANPPHEIIVMPNDDVIHLREITKVDTPTVASKVTVNLENSPADRFTETNDSNTTNAEEIVSSRSKSK